MSGWQAESRQRAGVEGWTYAAAVFWFEIVGILGFVGGVLAQPLFCYGDPAPGSPGACPEGLPPYIQDGTLVEMMGEEPPAVKEAEL